ncbi:MAG: CCA tRNA nucleotidyltransferase [Phycisphaerales bacterium]|nr:CCA tRNA nucleotidyltransferase [Phycisphaerales bacterium]
MPDPRSHPPDYRDPAATPPSGNSGRAPKGSSQARQAALGIVERLRSAGHLAYFAGGCVRDELLGLAPTDYDIATDATPDRISALFPRTAHVGAAFGVVLVIEQDCPVEVATFRSDGPYSDARRPDRVHFSDPESDARRRDFTINAIFLDPLAPAGGQVIDYVGGQADLAAKVVRAVGEPEARLSEDHLRALRAVRFAARLGFELESATALAVKRHAAQLRGVSRERIGDEVRRIMDHPSRPRAVGLLGSLSLDSVILNEPPAPSREVPITLQRLGNISPQPVFSTFLAGWALDRFSGTWNEFSKALDSLVSRWRRALCLSNTERDEFAGVLRGYDLIRTKFLDASVAEQKRLAARSWWADALLLVAARPVWEEGGGDTTLPSRVRERFAELATTPGGIQPEPVLTGDDLAAEGFKPGPAYKKILDAVYDAQLEGRISSREEALELARMLGV